MRSSAHAQLSRELAVHLRKQGYKCWIEAQRVGRNSYGDSPRIDVLAFRPWTGRKDFEMIAFEVKVTASDLKRDLTSGKWRSYPAVLGVPRVAIACPEGLTTAADLPDDLGLFSRREDGTWRRHRLGRCLEGDQRKLDPLLLLWCLSGNQQPPGPAHWQTRLDRQRSALPTAALKLIDDVDLGAFEVRNLLATASLRRGKAISKKIETVLQARGTEESRIPQWSLELLALVASLTDTPSDVLRSEVEEGHTQPVVDRLRRLLEVFENVERMSNVLYGVGHVMMGWPRSKDRLAEIEVALQAGSSPPPATIASRGKRGATRRAASRVKR